MSLQHKVSVSVLIAPATVAALLTGLACRPAAGQDLLDGLKRLGNALADTAAQAASSAADGVRASNGEVKVRGYVPLQGGQTLTCFAHLPSGLVSNGGPIEHPAQGRAAAIMVTTAKGQVVTGVCDKLAADGVLMPYLPPGGGAQAGQRRCGTNAEGVSYTPDGRMVLNHDAACNGTNVMANGAVNCKLNVDGTPIGKYDKSDDPRIGSVVKQTARASHCIETQRQQAVKEIRAEEAAARKR